MPPRRRIHCTTKVLSYWGLVAPLVFGGSMQPAQAADPPAAVAAAPATPADRDPAAAELPPALRRFIGAKEKQARREAERVGLELTPAVTEYFKIASSGDWSQALEMYPKTRRSIAVDDEDPDRSMLEAVERATLLEVQLALEQVMDSNPTLAVKLGEAMIASVTKGAIYFGGTDGGRGLPTALSASHEQGEPFFTLTQNALADGQYLAYLRGMYGTRIEVPSKQDSDQAFQDYLADAQRRLTHDQAHPDEPRQIKPGENVKEVNGRIQVSGHVAVMGINARLAKAIFERNGDREFFVEESFPLDWMYPHLAPAGMLMKLHREPREQLSAADVEKDQAYWTSALRPLLGDVARSGSSLSNTCEFARKVYGEQNLNGFKGDPAFVQAEKLRRMCAKLRAAIAGVYAWRMERALEPSTRQRMARAAEAAYLQAFAVCPSSPEVVFRYVNLLMSQARLADGLQVAELAADMDSGQQKFEALVKEIRRMQENAGNGNGKPAPSPGRDK